MTHEQRARELVARWEHGDEIHRQWLRDIAIPDLAKAFTEVRRETLKEIRTHSGMRPDLDALDLTPEERHFAREGAYLQLRNFRIMLDEMISGNTSLHTEIQPPSHPPATAEIRREALLEAIDVCIGVYEKENALPSDAPNIRLGRNAICLGALRCRDALYAILHRPASSEPSEPHADRELIIQTLAQSANVDRYTTKGKAYWEAVQRLFGR